MSKSERHMNYEVQFNSEDPRSSPSGLKNFPPGTRWQHVDRELSIICSRFQEKARRARFTAKKARDRGDMVKWQKFNAVARVWEMAALHVELVGCPF